MREENIQAQKRKGEDRIPPEVKDDEQKPSPNRNCEDRIPPNKKQVDIREISKEP